MTESTASRSIRVEVFVRTHASADVVKRVRNLVARARRLEETDRVDGVAVETWTPVRPALEELSDTGPSVTLTVETFQTWAEREGYALRPAFRRHRTASMLGGQSTAEIRVPVVCVAVYEDETLACVAPCTRADVERPYSVEECLAALEDGAVDPFALAESDDSDRSGRRPTDERRTRSR